MLNLLDADDLAATEDVLRAAVRADKGADVGRVLKDLVKRGILFRRGQAGGYRLWSASSVNLDAALSEAAKTIGEMNGLGAQLAPHLDDRPIAARKHYLKFGTLRYFEVRYSPVASLAEIFDGTGNADGRVIVALPETEADRRAALALGKSLSRDDTILVVPDALSALGADLRDIKLWQFVIGNTPELADDPFALAEADRQLKRALERLALNLEAFVGLRSSLAATTVAYRKGVQLKIGADRRLAGVVSSVCDDVYTDSPLIMSELLNRNSLSSAASAARMRLIEGIFTSPGAPFLGIEEAKSPPEKSMYFSVLAKGKVHRKSKDRYFVEEPAEGEDPLRLRPALSKVMECLEKAKGGRVSVDKLFDELRKPPFGVRDGVAPLLLAIVVSTRAHEIAIYEDGTFIPRFGPSDFLRLTKQSKSFECQLCRVVGVRADVFRRLLEVFSAETPKGRSSDLLDVVTPLCRFAVELPEFTRRTLELSSPALGVREALLNSRDPSGLIFSELPRACGTDPFDHDSKQVSGRIEEFVSRLRSATEELRDAYPKLLARVVADVARGLGIAEANFDRGDLAKRAARVALAAREPRLRGFSNKLRDPGLSEDAWIESLATGVVSKPPAKWTGADHASWSNEIAILGETFLRVEATAFAAGPEPRKTAVRIGLTRADGREIARVIETRPELEEDVTRAILEIDKVLGASRADRLSILYRMLWDDLGGPAEDTPDDDDVSRAGTT